MRRLRQVLADRVLAWPELPRGRLTDNDDRLRSGAIVGSEVSSGADRSPQCRKEARLDDIPIHREKASVRRLDPWNRQGFTPDFEASGHAGGHRHALHVRQLAHAIDQFASEERSRRLGVSGLCQIERRELDTARIEARID